MTSPTGKRHNVTNMPIKKPQPTAPEECPVCGISLEPYYRACPECGACHDTGWREDADEIASAESFDDEEAFDYEEFVSREFGGKHLGRPKHVPAWVWLLAILLLIGLVFSRILS